MKKSPSQVFAERIAELRRERHLTQAELSERIGMKRGVVAYYEFCAKNPTLETVRRFADFFGVLIGELVEEGAKDAPPPGPVPKIERQVARVRRLSPARQRMISKALDALIEG